MAVLWLAILLILSAPQVAADTLSQAQNQFELGQYRQAKALLEGAPDLSRDARMQYWLARVHYELRDWDKAIASAEKAVELDGSRSEYHQWLARACGEKAERSRSLFLARRVKKELEEAVRLGPSNVSARRDLVHYYLEAPWIAGGSKDKAREQIESIAALDAVQGHLARADYWREENKLDEVEREYRQVLQASPTSPDPYFEIADYYLDRNDAARVEQAAEQAARVNPTDSRLGFFRGVARVLSGNRAGEAEQMLRGYLQSVSRSENPSHASALAWLGTLFERQGKRKEAATQYRAALEINPQHEGAREGLKRVGE